MLLTFLAVAVGYSVVMFVLMRLAVRARKRGIGASLMSGVDQVFHPIAYDSHLEIQVQEERMVPLTSPDGPPEDGRPGRDG